MKLVVGLLVEKKLSHMRIHSINIKEFETIDDVLDAMEETSMFEMYSIEYTDEYMAEFVENIQKQ